MLQFFCTDCEWKMPFPFIGLKIEDAGTISDKCMVGDKKGILLLQ